MDYPKPIKRPGTKIRYFFYTDPITGKRKQKSTGKALAREAKDFIRDFIDDLYGLRLHESKPLVHYLDLFAETETNPKYQEALITEAHYTLGHAKTVARIMKQLRDEVLVNTSYLSRNLADFTSADIKKIAQMIVKKFGQTRKSQNIYIQFKGLFNYAADIRVIPYSPAAKLRNIKYEETPRAFLSLEALKLIISRPELHQSEQAHVFISFAALTGLRRGELIALHSSQFTEKYLLVNQALDSATGNIKETKSYKERKIPLAECARQIIEPYLDDEVMFNKKGKMVHTRTVAGWFAVMRQSVSEDKGIPIEIKEEVAETTLHSLRHSLAKHLRFSGIHDSVVRAYMGWELDKNKDMLERYTHASDYLQECADMVDNLFKGKIIPVEKKTFVEKSAQ